MTAGDERTSTKARYTLCDVSVDEKCFRCSNAPKSRSTLGKEPELGIDERSGGDRVSQGFLQQNRDGHDQVRTVHSS